MTRILILALCATLTTFARADPISITVEIVEQYADGTAMPLSDVEAVTVYCGEHLARLETGASEVVIELPVGIHECYGRTKAKNGLTSNKSNVVIVTVEAEIVRIKPRPPNLTVE